MAVIAPGGEIGRGGPGALVARHHHLAPYAALVLSGGYVEAGDRGRFRAEAGDVLIHGRFEAHQDRFGSCGAAILNLPLAVAPAWPFGRVGDPDAVVRAAERDPTAATRLLIETSVPATGLDDWPDLLAEALRGDHARPIGEWASSFGLRPQSLSRGFRLAYGVSPQRYRLELRAARAARTAAAGAGRLAELAAEAGFADQPHMTRAIRAVYGAPPAALGRNVQCVQDRRSGAA
jgi:AraC-like DNA-binding protein